MDAPVVPGFMFFDNSKIWYGYILFIIIININKISFLLLSYVEFLLLICIVDDPMIIWDINCNNTIFKNYWIVQQQERIKSKHIIINGIDNS